jgi:hypothetical protein
MIRPIKLVGVFIAASLLPSFACADNLIDHQVNKDTGGIYRAQDAVPIALGLFTLGCAVWEGTEGKLGRTCWESGEATAGTILAVKALQFVTNRESPETTKSANHFHFFKASGFGSFPSTHVATTTALVTPFILEYADDNPWAYALALLPAYEMVARVKAQAHWQTDVLVGAAVGYAIGAYEADRGRPFVFGLLPGGAYAGISASFY